MVKRKRKKYSAATKAKILAAANAGNLTATDVKKKFGVTPVTYYSWRKKLGTSGKGSRRLVPGGGADFDQAIRSQVQAKVRQLLPEVVRSEVGAYLDSLFGAGRGRRKTPGT